MIRGWLQASDPPRSVTGTRKAAGCWQLDFGNRILVERVLYGTPVSTLGPALGPSPRAGCSGSCS